jgi:hypothetical protein
MTKENTAKHLRMPEVRKEMLDLAAEMEAITEVEEDHLAFFAHRIRLLEKQLYRRKAARSG